MDQDSDDSDSEIFRVKRRTSLKVDKRDVNEATRSKHSDHQVYFVDVLISDAYIGGLNYLILGTYRLFHLCLCCVIYTLLWFILQTIVFPPALSWYLNPELQTNILWSYESYDGAF